MTDSHLNAIFKRLNQWYNEILLKGFLGDMKPMLSKSRFLAGLQCPLRLWYQCYDRKLATPASPTQLAIFDLGHEVGLLATKLYPAGLFVSEDYMHHPEAQKTTDSAITNPDLPAIFEGAFVFDNIRIRVDILERLNNDRWNMIEVKSSTSAKEVYINDAAVQYYVLNGSGLALDRVGILHLNNQYVYDGAKLDLNQLFHFTDLTAEIRQRQFTIALQVENLKTVISSDSPPNISPSRHCLNPYKCEFWEHCTRDKPDFWVMSLAGITNRKFLDLAEIGVETIDAIPENYPLTALQDRIRQCVSSNQEFISPNLRSELLDVQYPIHFLDFETIAPAVPRYAGTRPYETVPFQLSDHILLEDGTIEHREYLCMEDKDPRAEFAQTLLEALGETGTIFTYTGYEEGVLRGVARSLPHFKTKILDLTNRFQDLYAIIRRHYYHPLFHGSFSLKYVLPALVPSMSYENLSIQEGSLASLEYMRIINGGTSVTEKEKIRKNLLEYCGIDTLGMVMIRNELLKRTSD
jgi:predicted RecB family nuclease